jgi:hypothetical protein
MLHWLRLHRSFQARVSLDHLVGTNKHRRRYFQAERPCGLLVDDKLKGGRLLNRQITGFVTLQELVEILRRSLEKGWRDLHRK